jgi:hypothetical protein
VTTVIRLFLLALLAPLGTSAQTAPAQPLQDPVLRRMWDEGMTERSQVYRLSQQLMDSVGPRLMGSDGHMKAIDWAMRQYASWGVEARREQYGTWTRWERGYTRMELIAPRLRDLDAVLLAYTRGTNGPVEGEVVQFPDLPDQAAFDRWLASDARGKFVLVTPPEPTCRPDENLIAHARPETVERLRAEARQIDGQWAARFGRAGGGLVARLDQAGVAGIIVSTWSLGWGVNKIMSGGARNVPMVDVSCEDNGLLARLAEHGQGPRVRLDAVSRETGEVPAFNVVGEIRGTELPNEYILMSAHFDSWDSASGATDNGTASVMLMEAMRILKAAYPNPRRTILAGHWGGEEQGLNGSGAFAADHPEIVDNIHFGFNQDNGTWRVEAIKLQGFDATQPIVQRWLDQIPGEISDTIAFTSPQIEGSSDHTSFTCHGAPVFRLQSNYTDYRQYTWHTNLDTFDKVIMDDLKNNATLSAMLIYLGDREAQRLPRTRDPLGIPNAQGQRAPWAACSDPVRSSGRN